MKSFIQSLYAGSRVLFLTGLLHLVLFFIFLTLSTIDTRIVYNESVWLKPMRFAISILIFTWTYAWISHLYLNRKNWVAVINGLMSICMIIEITLIFLQAARGIPSHFNVSTPLNAAIFSIMGGAIGLNAILLGIHFILFSFFDRGGGKYRSAIIWGMILFLLGNFAGYLMIRYGWPTAQQNLASAMPATGWKLKNGDIRILHALGLHAIQILPLSAWVLHKVNAHSRCIHWVGLLYLITFFMLTLKIFS